MAAARGARRGAAAPPGERAARFSFRAPNRTDRPGLRPCAARFASLDAFRRALHAAFFNAFDAAEAAEAAKAASSSAAAAASAAAAVISSRP